MVSKSVIGVEDGSFKSFDGKNGFTLLCCVLMDNYKILKVFFSRIQVDGIDATSKLLKMITDVEYSAIILGGVTFAGFNIIDPRKIFDEKQLPVVIYSNRKPNSEKILNALKKHFKDWDKRWSILQSLGNIYEFEVKPGYSPIYFEIIGETPEYAKSILKNYTIISRVPEPIRIAKIIARGVSLKDS
ncbi:DUF99 family protein [Candidatus Bathyarchaeota archaeon]|nr:DUF99 family protein [Candidatus Bathyarchaeota archaeon]MBS7630778.1 DUF99 family protein [Candidatus Bathyarchaeota archaeon]